MILLNPSIDTLVQNTFQGMTNDPKHALHWTKRQELFRGFETSLGDGPGWAMRGWLSVLTARYVLPIFTAYEKVSVLHEWFRNPDSLPEVAPSNLIALAEAVLKGEIGKDSDGVVKTSARAHYATGNFWGLREEEVPFNVYLAGSASLSALLESRRKDPFDSIASLSVISTNNFRVTSGEHLADEELVFTGRPDTAAAAAMAVSMKEHGKVDPQALLNFWAWWLVEAIPAAYIKAIRK